MWLIWNNILQSTIITYLSFKPVRGFLYHQFWWWYKVACLKIILQHNKKIQFPTSEQITYKQIMVWPNKNGQSTSQLPSQARAGTCGHVNTHKKKTLKESNSKTHSPGWHLLHPDDPEQFLLHHKTPLHSKHYVALPTQALKQY